MKSERVTATITTAQAADEINNMVKPILALCEGKMIAIGVSGCIGAMLNMIMDADECDIIEAAAEAKDEIDNFLEHFYSQRLV